MAPGVEYRPPRPCGECSDCQFGAEVDKMLEFVDRRMLPAAQEAARAVADARWRGAGEREARQLAREFEKAKAQWMEARYRVLTSDVIVAATCQRTGACYLIKQPEVEPPPVDAIPASVRDEMLREVAQAMPGHGDKCFRCGAALDHAPLLPLAVCADCFGREI